MFICLVLWKLLDFVLKLMFDVHASAAFLLKKKKLKFAIFEIYFALFVAFLFFICTSNILILKRKFDFFSLSLSFFF